MLDIDGVLVTLGSLKQGSGLYAQPDRGCIIALNSITRRTGAAIVVSSTWRLQGFEEIRKTLSDWGVEAKVIGITPVLTKKTGRVWVTVERCDEISLWLAGHPKVEQFVILDDDRDMGKLAHAHVQTSFLTGLTGEDAHRAIAILTAKFQPERSHP